VCFIFFADPYCYIQRSIIRSGVPNLARTRHFSVPYNVLTSCGVHQATVQLVPGFCFGVCSRHLDSVCFRGCNECRRSYSSAPPCMSSYDLTFDLILNALSLSDSELNGYIVATILVSYVLYE